MLLCIEYGILFVDTVNTKIKACNALSAIFVETVDTTVKTHPYIAFLIFNGFSIHKKFWKAEIQGFSTIPFILYMSHFSYACKTEGENCISCLISETA